MDSSLYVSRIINTIVDGRVKEYSVLVLPDSVNVYLKNEDESDERGQQTNNEKLLAPSRNRCFDH
jgi:hypothetical protein